jgi:hypothetical protein
MKTSVLEHRNSMKKNLLLLFLIIVYTNLNFAQTTASITWNLSITDSQKVSSAVGNILGEKETISPGPNGMVIASYDSTGQRLNQGTFGWLQETNQNDSRFIQFNASVKPGYTFTVTNVSFNYGFAKSTSAMKSNVYYSTDNWVTRTLLNTDGGVLVYNNSAMANFSKLLNLTIQSGSTLSVRIYPWWYSTTTTSTSKYAVHNKFVISGVTNVSGSGGGLYLTTVDVTSILSTTAKCGGNIVSDGGDVVTAKGVCWNTTGNPSVLDKKTNDGTGTGSYVSSLAGLTPLTKYYVRAYATNVKGTVYGSEMSFTTLDVPKLAFPSAEGYGRFTTGGRGGTVIEVTNLTDDNTPGSLRYAINQTSTRIIVFRVSGTIMLNSALSIKNGNLTIAGQTAPGEGICLGGYTPSIDADNVIVRFIRFRLGDLNNVEDDAFNGRNHKDIIIDHCSMTWSVDECASFYDNQNFTMQWCIIGESLYNSLHPKGAHGYGGIEGGWGATFHHNLYVSNTSRNPRFCGARYHHDTADLEIVDFVNNVIYNWGFNNVYGGELGQQNVRSNYYKPGPATKSGVLNRILNPSEDPGTSSSYGKFYVSDNFAVGFPTTSADNWTTGVQGVADAVKTQVKVSTQFPIADVRVQTPEQAYVAVLNLVGANYPSRDAVDSRLIQDTKTGSATFEGKTYKQNNSVPDPTKITGIIDSQTDVGGWPQLKSAAAPTDSDHDGMPDDWEKSKNLNPNDGSDRSNVAASGYTMLEEYLNGLVASIATDVQNENSLPSGFSLEQNYPNPFNPSTTITYHILKTNHVTLKVFDLLGREVVTLVDEIKQPGIYNSQFLPKASLRDNSQLSSGVYFYRLQAGEFVQTKKMVLMK